MQRAEILIIDDLMESVALLLRYLQNQAIDVMVALDGLDGLRKAREAQPAVILLDVVMPGMDGYSVCRVLKADPRTAHIPVIFLSAATRLQDKLDGFAAGGVDYICKPFCPEEVLARVEVQLRSANSARPLQPGQVADRRSTAVREPDWEHQVVTAALALLQEAGQECLTKEQLARKVGVNEKRLTELFRKHVGMTVAEYQISQKLELARAKLSHSNQKIQLIAEQAGYQNASDFSRAFRHRYGLGPREHRQASNVQSPSLSTTA
jgi:DNA-binding response OmpR family regulator